MIGNHAHCTTSQPANPCQEPECATAFHTTISVCIELRANAHTGHEVIPCGRFMAASRRRIRYIFANLVLENKPALILNILRERVNSTPHPPIYRFFASMRGKGQKLRAFSSIEEPSAQAEPSAQRPRRHRYFGDPGRWGHGDVRVHSRDRRNTFAWLNRSTRLGRDHDPHSLPAPAPEPDRLSC
jgi:hypothetical protein